MSLRFKAILRLLRRESLGAAVAFGVVIGIEVHAIIDAKATQIKADADMKMQGVINQQQIDKNKKQQQQQQAQPPTPQGAKEHTKGARPSTTEKHQRGTARKSQDRGGEKGDARRRPPRKRPDGWKGPWPPRKPPKPPKDKNTTTD